MNDLYEVLGVERNATTEEIKKAYKKLAQKHHPDRKGGDEEVFKDVKFAYEILSTEEKRRSYDNTGQTNDKPNIQQFADQLLSSVFEQIIASGRVGDYVKIAFASVESHHNQLVNARNKEGKDLKRLKNKSKRVKSKTEKNLYSATINRMIVSLRTSIIAKNNEIELLRLCMNELKNYNDVEPDEPKPSPSISGVDRYGRPFSFEIF